MIYVLSFAAETQADYTDLHQRQIGDEAHIFVDEWQMFRVGSR